VIPAERVRLLNLHGAAGRMLAVLKAKPRAYYDRMVDRIVEFLLDEESTVLAPRVRRILERLDEGEPTLARELELAINSLRAEMPRRAAKMLEDRIALTYIAGAVDVQPGNYAFNEVDERALDWLESDSLYWVGKHYGEKFGKKVIQTMAPAFADGAPVEVLAPMLREAFADEVTRGESYWKLFANSVVTRTRSFGITANLERIGAKYGVIEALIDDTTTDICRGLDGKLVLVENMVNLRGALISAKSPEEVRELHPWVSNGPDAEAVVASTEALGFVPSQYSFPPYHANCRTTVVYFGE